MKGFAKMRDGMMHRVNDKWSENPKVNRTQEVSRVEVLEGRATVA